MKASGLKAVGASPDIFVTDRIISRCRSRIVAAMPARVMLTADRVRTLCGHIVQYSAIPLDLRGIDKHDPLMLTLMMNEKLPALTDGLRPAPKKRGRKPGGGKVPGSGRKPGGKNKIPTDMREVILARGKPLELLCDISRGVKIRVGPQAGPSEAQYTYPTLQERAAAAKILIDKLMPAASVDSATGKDGAPLVPDQTNRERAKKLLAIMARARAEGNEKRKQLNREDAIEIAFVTALAEKELRPAAPDSPRKPAETRSAVPAPVPTPVAENAPDGSAEAQSRWVDPSRLLHPSQCDEPPEPRVIRFRPKGVS